MNEIWKSVADFEGYEISDQGRVKSLDRIRKGPHGGFPSVPAKILKLIPYGEHLAVGLSRGVTTIKRVDRLVLESFVGPCPSPGMQVRHLNDIPTDNRRETLEWTPKENGERNGIQAGQKFARLTVIARVGSDSCGRWHWQCHCSCGGRAIIRSDNLK